LTPKRKSDCCAGPGILAVLKIALSRTRFTADDSMVICLTAAYQTVTEAAFFIPIMLLWTGLCAALFIDYRGLLTRMSERASRFRNTSLRFEWSAGRFVSAAGFLLGVGAIIAELVGIARGRVG
jgi:hypothetical protein